jgi:competence protein ComEC
MEKKKSKIIILGIFLIMIGLYLLIPDGKMRIIFCDVGQGDGAIVIKGNWQMVIDTGADNGKMERCLDRYIPFWDKSIEGVLISHWDEDHSGALYKLIKSYRVENLFESTVSGKLLEKEVKTNLLRAGDKVRYGDVNFEVVYPRDNVESGNESSLVVVLDYMNKKLVFAGDVDSNSEGEIMGWWKERVEGIKVSHHGSSNGNSTDWLKKLGPALAIISVGENNYGHPTEIVLDRLKGNGVKILRTDIEEDIILGWN